MAVTQNFIQITPFMHVDDLEAALRFFNDVLGFETKHRQPGYAYVEREGAAIRMMQNKGDDGAPPGNRRFAYYVDVRDVDALYAELKPRLDKLPPRDVHGPADKPYGQRELLVVAPDGNLIAFGQALRGQAPRFTVLWEFRVRAGCEEQFAQAYGQRGPWVELFRKGEGYVRTELLRDEADPRRFVTIDVWDSATQYEAFLVRYADEYRRIDAACEGWTETERPLSLGE